MTGTLLYFRRSYVHHPYIVLHLRKKRLHFAGCTVLASKYNTFKNAFAIYGTVKFAHHNTS